MVYMTVLKIAICKTIVHVSAVKRILICYKYLSTFVGLLNVLKLTLHTVKDFPHTTSQIFVFRNQSMLIFIMDYRSVQGQTKCKHTTAMTTSVMTSVM